jgi:hypothetical protein
MSDTVVSNLLSRAGVEADAASVSAARSAAEAYIAGTGSFDALQVAVRAAGASHKASEMIAHAIVHHLRGSSQ